MPNIQIDVNRIDDKSGIVYLPKFEPKTFIITGWCVGYHTFTGILRADKVDNLSVVYAVKSKPEKMLTVAHNLQRPDVELLFPLYLTLVEMGPVVKRSSAKANVFYQPHLADKTGRMFRLPNLKLDTLQDDITTTYPPGPYSPPDFADTQARRYDNHIVELNAKDLMPLGVDFDALFKKYIKKVLKALKL